MAMSVNLCGRGVDLIFRGKSNQWADELAAIKARMPLVPLHRFPNTRDASPALRLVHTKDRANTGGRHEVAQRPAQITLNVSDSVERGGAPCACRPPRANRGTEFSNSAVVAEDVAAADQRRLSSEPAVVALAQVHAAAAVSDEDGQ